MVFSSLPLYLDPPNWQPLPNQQPGGSTTQNPNQIPPPPPPPPPPPLVSGSCGAIIRAGSMTDRARLAKIPQPEAGLKCPRCESINTKFCYFNNYNLSQPRHFCKTCRRYWTRGGSLRNVPVGGGCRRNKRTKPQNRSKSPAAEPAQLPGSSSHLPFLSSLHHLSAGAGAEFSGNPNSPHWRMPQAQQFPFLANLEPYSFEPAEPTRFNLAGQLGLNLLKMEDNKELNFSRNFQFWPVGSANNVNAWAGADISGFSSSTSQLL